MNSPIDPCLIPPRPAAWPAHLPPVAEVPILDPSDGAEQAAEDARFVDGFLRAEAGRGPLPGAEADD